MPISVTSSLPYIEEEEAAGEVARIYDEVKRELETPFVPNIMKALSVSPAALATYWALLRTFYQHTTLPQSLTAMIIYTIAQRNNCEYCSANHELTCRTLGIDEGTLAALVEDLGNVSPERLQAIIRFAVKVSRRPKDLTARDYERLREHGVTDEELVEIVMIAAAGNLGDTLADALKVEVEPAIAEALGR